MIMSTKYPYGHELCDNTYDDYVAEQLAYGFTPLDEETWTAWQKARRQNED